MVIDIRPILAETEILNLLLVLLVLLFMFVSIFSSILETDLSNASFPILISDILDLPYYPTYNQIQSNF